MKLGVIGAGSSYTPELLKGFLDISKDVDIDEIWLYDINDEKLDVIYEFAKKFIKDVFKVHKTKDFEEAVRDSDYVVFQFRPGGLEGRLKDETIPLKYGLIGQETTGVGGFAAALRAFPVIEDYVNRIEKTSKATIINFTNPSGHITEFVLNYLKFDRYIGLCNIPINLLKALSDFLSCSMDDLFLKYYGLNHLTFLERIYVNGKDVTDEFFKKLGEVDTDSIGYGFESSFLKEIGMVLNPYLRYYLRTSEMLEKLKNSKPRAQEVMEIEKELFEKYKSVDNIPEELSKRGGSLYSTAAALLIRDLALGNGKIHIVNTKNNGSVKNLPDDYVMELPSLVKGGKVLPVTLGEASRFAKVFINTIKEYERLTIEAYLKKSKTLAKEALLVHPLGPEIKDVGNLLDDIIKANNFGFLE